MTSIVCFEVFSRYVLNEPTYWGTDVATYILVGMTFLGLAQAQKAGEPCPGRAPGCGALPDTLAPSLRHLLQLARPRLRALRRLADGDLQLSGVRQRHARLGSAGDAAVDPASFPSPSATPRSPSPSSPTSCATAARRGCSAVLGPVLVVALAAVLFYLGDRPMKIPGYRLDVGSIAVVVVALAGVLLVNGARMSSPSGRRSSASARSTGSRRAPRSPSSARSSWSRSSCFSSPGCASR